MAGDEVCAVHEYIKGSLDRIEASVRRIEGRLGSGDVTLAEHALRVAHLEKLVYGATATALTALVAAVVKLVI